MSFLFKSRPKNPAEVVQATDAALRKLETASEQKQVDKSRAETSKALFQLKTMLLNSISQGSEELSLTIQQILNAGLLEKLVGSLPQLEFESRKDAATIFSLASRQENTVDYLHARSAILFELFRGYGHAEIALHCGQMLREAIKYQSLARIVMFSEEFWKFFDYIELPNFDVASDAFASFRDLIVQHAAQLGEFLQLCSEKFFECINRLLYSENYVTRRQSLKLLGDILAERACYDAMLLYVSNADNLKLSMNLLRDRNRSIQLEAFHIFVANPSKPTPVLDILARNKDKMLRFLEGFQSGRSNDLQFLEEKLFLAQQIQMLCPPTHAASEPS